MSGLDGRRIVGMRVPLKVFQRLEPGSGGRKVGDRNAGLRPAHVALHRHRFAEFLRLLILADDLMVR